MAGRIARGHHAELAGRDELGHCLDLLLQGYLVIDILVVVWSRRFIARICV